MKEKMIRSVAWADLAVTLPFALPFVAEAVIALIYFLDQRLGFGTPSTLFEMGPLAIMFVHIMGVLGVVWALARLCMPSPLLARIDATARLVVAALIVYAIAQGTTPVLWVFVLTEIGGCLGQVLTSNRKGPST